MNAAPSGSSRNVRLSASSHVGSPAPHAKRNAACIGCHSAMVSIQNLTSGLTAPPRQGSSRAYLSASPEVDLRRGAARVRELQGGLSARTHRVKRGWAGPVPGNRPTVCGATSRARFRCSLLLLALERVGRLGLELL